MNERKTVYSAYDRRVVFEGTAAECWAWLMAQADQFDGRTFYRTWESNGDRFIDVGSVYIFNE